MTKDQVRVFVKKLTQDLTPNEIKQKSDAITQLFFDEFHITNQDIHIYRTKEGSHEVSTEPLVKKLLKEYPVTKLITSISNFEDFSLTHYLFDVNTAFKESKHGIPEPLEATPYERTPDIIIVPLLGYDVEGNRVGFGKGFYDRFLSKCPTSFKVGLSLVEPVPEIEDVNVFDVKLDYCINPDRVIKF